MALIKAVLKVYSVLILLQCKSYASMSCTSLAQQDFGCPFSLLSTTSSWCLVETYSMPFSFHMKTGYDFTQLKIGLKTNDVFIGLFSSQAVLDVDRNWLPTSDEWYRIDIKEMVSGYFSLNTHYSLYINGTHKKSIKLKVQKAQSFAIWLSGTAFYSTSCNPADFKPPVPQTDASHLNIWLLYDIYIAIKGVVIALSVIIIAVNEAIKRREVRSKHDDVKDPKYQDYEEPIEGAIYTDVQNSLTPCYAMDKIRDYERSSNSDCHIYEDPSTQDDPNDHIYEEIEDYICYETRDGYVDMTKYNKETHTYESVEDIRAAFCSANDDQMITKYP